MKLEEDVTSSDFMVTCARPSDLAAPFFFNSLQLFVRFAFRFIVIIIITIFGARCAAVCLRWCEEFIFIGSLWRGFVI